jgi:hypothetical protein
MIDRVILLTAAITPIQSFKGSLRDPDVRLNQYNAALHFWASVSDRVDARVVVVETTGADLGNFVDSLPSGQHRRIMVFPYTPSITAVQNGIGAIEAEALDAAMLSLAAGRTANALVAKVTGRLRVHNAIELLAPHDNSTVLARRSLDRRYVDSRFFQVPVTLWNSYMTGLASEISDQEGRYFEHAIAYRLILGEYEQALRVVPFARRPIVQGVSGTTGKRYGRRFSRAVNMPLSWTERRIASCFGSKQV